MTYQDIRDWYEHLKDEKEEENERGASNG